MADEIIPVESLNKAAIVLPTTDEFINSISLVLNGGNDEVRCRFIFTNNAPEVRLSESTIGTPLYNQTDLAELKLRFDIALTALRIMEDKKFVISRLEIANRNGLSGVSLIFFTPSGQRHKFDYFRVNDDAPSLIPNDFLQDLKMFPVRYGG